MKEKDNLDFVYDFFKKGSKIKIDSRQIKVGDIFLAIKGEKVDGNNFALSALEQGAELVIVDDPEVFKQLKEKYLAKVILADNSIKFLQDLARKHRSNLKIPFLSITGSNGKTTTKELITTALSKKYNVLCTEGNLNNHIGVPLTILSVKPEHNFAVIEMGANHLGEIKLLADIANPDFGIITNIGKAHIGEFGSFENIIKAKTELYDKILESNGIIFINPKDQILMEASKGFGGENKVFYEVGRILDSSEYLIAEIAGHKIKSRLVGSYNLANLQVAFSVAQYFSIETESIVDSLKKYNPSNNRSQLFKSERNNEVVLDCYNANPSSMKLAIESFEKMENQKTKAFILGEMKELGEVSKQEHKIVLDKLKSNHKEVYLIGEEFLNFKDDFPKFNFFNNIDQLVDFFAENPLKNKSILVKGSNSVNLIKLKEKNIL